MKKNVFSAKEFTNVVKGAKVELNGIFKSPFIVVNLLNKAAKGDFSKVEGANVSKENIAKVAKVLKSMHSERYAFNLDLLTKDNKGRFATVATSKVMPIWDYQLIDVLPNKGYKYYKPIQCTINSIFNAFAKVAKVDIIETEKAAKESEKAAKKAAKEFENAKKCIIKDYNSGMFGESILAEKLANLRTKYGK